MAKVVTLTVQVDDAQFQAFTKNFDAFVTKVGTLTTAFQSIQTSVNNTTRSAQTLNNTLTGLLASSNRLHTSISGLTQHFGKWVSLIGATVMMLGGGVGMFGIDRLLNQFIQRQRQALGAGSSYQQSLAATTAGQQFPGSVQSQLGNIFDARHDPQHPAAGLFRPGNILGINAAEGISDENVRRQLLRTLPRKMLEHRGHEETFARSIHAEDILGIDKVRSLIGPEGVKTGEKEAALSERIEKAVPPLTDEEKKKLDDLYEAWTTFAQVFQQDLLKMIAQLKPFLLTQSGASTTLKEHGQDILDSMKEGNWIDLLLGKPGKGGVRDLIPEEWMGAAAKEFKIDMNYIDKGLGNLVSKLNSLNLGGGAGDAGGPGGSSGIVPGRTTGPSDTSAPPAPPAPNSLSSSPSLSSIPPPGNITPPAAQKYLNSFINPKPTSIPTTKVAPSSAPWMSNPNYIEPLKPLLPSFTAPAEKHSSLGGTQRAIAKAAPGKGGLNSMFANYNHSLLASLNAPGGPLARPGALDMDNYQMGRTAQIHVHNEHPSIRMEMAGMT